MTAGHNSNDPKLKGLIERVERLIGERKDINTDIAAVMAEAKAAGYDPKIMRQVIRLRAMDDNDRREMEELLDKYKVALGLDLV